MYAAVDRVADPDELSGSGSDLREKTGLDLIFENNPDPDSIYLLIISFNIKINIVDILTH